jgi:hypothetical protein
MLENCGVMEDTCSFDDGRNFSSTEPEAAKFGKSGTNMGLSFIDQT